MQDLKNRWPTALFATHSFTNSSSPNEIEKYLDFLDNWYENHQSELQSGELEKFKNKVEGVRKEWPFKVSHLVLLGMRRQSKPDKRYLSYFLKNCPGTLSKLAISKVQKFE